jgi:hypothetical protein
MASLALTPFGRRVVWRRLKFRVQGSGFRVQSSGFRVQSSEFDERWQMTNNRQISISEFSITNFQIIPRPVNMDNMNVVWWISIFSVIQCFEK